MMKMKWCICDDECVLIQEKEEHIRQRNRPGVMKKALLFDSKGKAELYLDHLNMLGFWPLFAPNARVEEIRW